MSGFVHLFDEWPRPRADIPPDHGADPRQWLRALVALMRQRASHPQATPVSLAAEALTVGLLNLSDGTLANAIARCVAVEKARPTG